MNKMEAKVKQPDLRNEFWTGEKCYITELSNTSDDQEVSIARTRVEPGVTTCWHRLRGVGERYYILKGQGLMELRGLLTQEVNPGDIVLIPSMCPQRITNIGSEDLIFLAICTPRFSPERYEELEDELPAE